MKSKVAIVHKPLGQLALWLGLLGMLAAPALNTSADDGDWRSSMSPELASTDCGFLAVGVPGEDIEILAAIIPDVGKVNVLYSSAAGLSSSDNQSWLQASTGILDESEADDGFGHALATGDFNGDGHSDLAMGVPCEDLLVLPTAPDAGAVNVLYGSAAGLSVSDNQFWHQASDGILDEPEEEDHFGQALATGDFNGDGRSDLAVGVPGESFLGLPPAPAAGAVNVLYGQDTGLSSSGNQYWHQSSDGILSELEEGDSFGQALATGDFNGDGHSDLAVGVPGEDFYALPSIKTDAGAVNVLYGSAAGLTASDNQFWSRDLVEAMDRYGWAVAAGDFDGDGYSDLAVGAPYDDIYAMLSVGSIEVLYGSAAGLSADDRQSWHQGSPDIEGGPEAGDRFGYALAAGDFDGDGYDDLAVGVPGEDWVESNAGAVNVLYGSAAGLSAAGNQLWGQASADILNEPELDDAFGHAVAVGDLNGDGYSDLAVGVPGEGFLALPPISGAGAVNVLYGSAAGLSAAGNQFWNQGSVQPISEREDGDHFGWALAICERPTTHRIYLPLVLR